MHPIARFALAALVAIAAVSPLPATEKEGHKEATRTRLEHFSAEMERIRFWIINSGAKVKGNAMSMHQGDDGLPDRPSTRCCAVNVLRLEEHLEHLVDRWKDLESCYLAEENTNSHIQLNFVRSDAGSLVRAYENFRNAPKENLLLPAYQAMIKGFLLLEDSAGKLDECGEPILR